MGVAILQRERCYTPARALLYSGLWALLYSRLWALLYSRLWALLYSGVGVAILQRERCYTPARALLYSGLWGLQGLEQIRREVEDPSEPLIAGVYGHGRYDSACVAALG